MDNYDLKFIGVFETRMGRDIVQPIDCIIHAEGVAPRKNESLKFSKEDLEDIAKKK